MNTKYNPAIHHRKSIRLRDYDYAQAGAYFITICAHRKQLLFGEIVNDAMRLNAWGEIVVECWDAIPQHFPNTATDAFVVMPNHVHGIIWIGDDRRGGVAPPRRDGRSDGDGRGDRIGRGDRAPTLGQIIAYFKYQSAKAINQLRQMPGVPIWQRNYYERIIRDERELHNIRQYVAANPLKWALDKDNPRVA